ncbi:MAG: hypothetical protein QM831_20350 [Kofleriaceae bacterium]
MWPERSAICIGCRQLLEPGGACPAGHPQTTALVRAPDREKLVAEVWGPPNYRRMIKDAAKAGATGGGVGSVVGSSCDIPDLGGDVAIFALVIFVVVGIVYFTSKLIGYFVRKRQHELRANGAAQKLLPAGFSTGRTGTIVHGNMYHSPIDNQLGVAYVVQLTQRGRTMLYDAATVGFEVLLEGDQRVVIPAGTCMIDLVDAPKIGSALYLAKVDPLRKPNEDFDPFLHDRSVGRTLKIGDSVEVLGQLVAQPVGAGGGYREAPETVLVPVGVPALRVR